MESASRVQKLSSYHAQIYYVLLPLKSNGLQGKGMKFGGQEVRGQSHMRPKKCLEAWQSHHSSPLESSRLSS